MNAYAPRDVGFLRLAVALALPAAVLLVEFVFWEFLRPYAWLLLCPAVFVAALVGGLWGGIGATLLGTALVAFYLAPVHIAPMFPTAAVWPPVFIFAATGVLFSVFAHRLREEERVSERLGGDRRHRQLFERARDGIVYLDRRGNYLDANPAYCALTGYSRAELLAMSAFQVIAPQEESRLRDFLAGCPVSPAQPSRWLLLARDGGTLHVEASTIREADGSLMAIVRDIGAQLNSEERLSQAGALNQAVLDSVTAQMAVIDREGIVVATNEAWREFSERHCADRGAHLPDLVADRRARRPDPELTRAVRAPTEDLIGAESAGVVRADRHLLHGPADVDGRE